jgi:hypothetical protein
MGQLTFKRFKRNDVFVHLTSEEEITLFKAWLKRNDYVNRTYGDRFDIGKFVCHGGWGDNLSTMVAGDNSIASVYALEGMMDVPKVKMTMTNIEIGLGLTKGSLEVIA